MRISDLSSYVCSSELFHLRAYIVHRLDSLGYEFLVLPSVLEDVPEHAPEHRDIGAGANEHILGRMCSSAGKPRLDDDEVCLVVLLALAKVLQRDGMGHRGLAAHHDESMGVASGVEKIGNRDRNN